MAGRAAALPEVERLSFRPADAATRDDFIALFEGPGGPKYCWCMVWRSSNAERSGATNATRKANILRRLDAGTPLGLVGYAGDMPAAWVSIAPKQTHSDRLGGPTPGPDESVWSLTCLYLRRAARGRGLGTQLIEAAVHHAAQQGATAIEAYPVDPDSPSYRYMGFIPAFARLGFAETGTVGIRRHIMRLTLSRQNGDKG